MISRLEMNNHQLGIERKESLKELEKNLTKAVKDTVTDRVDFEKMFRAIIHEDNVVLWRKNLRISGQILTAARELSEAAELTQNDQDFLRSLHFRNQESRYQNIEDAHTKTFAWILEENTHQGARESTSTFKDWLETKNGIYWISGKPGSGKSTLMKFLWNNERTDELLRIWAGGKPLATANFHFWNTGSALQKSQEGLLRSIIFELLRKCPDLIPAARRAVTFELRLRIDDSRWEIKDLLSMYTTIVGHDVDMKFCLFIDGLDEFGEERRTQRDLLNTIRSLNYSPNIKICLSSRPWTEFLDEFGNDSNHLKLENLTRGDIKRYVNDHFKAHPQFGILNAQNAAYSDFIQLVLDRAQGVFLWVFLVMRELLKGLTHHDSLKTLQTRLDRFPPDLEQFFKVLIDQVDPIYHKQMAQYFYVAVTARTPLPARYYSFMDDLEDMVAPVIDASLYRMPIEDERRRDNQLRRRLDGRTRGLLELKSPRESPQISGFWGSQVEFLHRTVRDFLHDSRDIQKLFERELADKNPSWKACEAILVSWKTILFDDSNQYFMDKVTDDRDNFVLFGSLCHETPSDAVRLQKILDVAEEASSQLKRTRSEISLQWYFITLGASIGLYEYLDSNAKSRPQLFAPGVQSNEDYTLLYYALFYAPAISLECVNLLLEKGASPNEPTRVTEKDSVWHYFLRTLEKGEVTREKAFIYDLLALLIVYGADFTVSPENKDLKSTVDLLTNVLDERMAMQLHKQFLQKQPQTRNFTTSTEGSGQERRKGCRNCRLCCWF